MEPSTRIRHRQIGDDKYIAIGSTGDHVFLTSKELRLLQYSPGDLHRRKQELLKSKFILTDDAGLGMKWLERSRRHTKQSTVLDGPSLHIIVLTLSCTLSCKYCQVSRSAELEGFSIDREKLKLACESIFQSPSQALTVEFQGGEPLLRFDLIVYAIEYIEELNKTENRDIRFVVCSTLHLLNESMCQFFLDHRVFLSTSIDGPPDVHNANRKGGSKSTFQRTVEGISLARSVLGKDSVSALMTTTRSSLNHAKAIVDTYVSLGFGEIFIRPLNHYGFAKKNSSKLYYEFTDFAKFYAQAFERVLFWNRSGVAIREVWATIGLNKILSPYDCGFVDLQQPVGTGLSVLVYNYDGYVYPSDEARMLAAGGCLAFRMGEIGTDLEALLHGCVQSSLMRGAERDEYCRQCAYSSYCGPDPVSTFNEWGCFDVEINKTKHCREHQFLFDYLFSKLSEDDIWVNNLFYRWARS